MRRKSILDYPGTESLNLEGRAFPLRSGWSVAAEPKKGKDSIYIEEGVAAETEDKF